jgi:hypothetical protein
MLVHNFLDFAVRQLTRDDVGDLAVNIVVDE